GIRDRNVTGVQTCALPILPGFAEPETLLYSPELKFYSNKVRMDTDLNTSVEGLHCLGDASGWTRGLMMASVMGVLMGRKLAEREIGRASCREREETAAVAQ